MSWPAAKRLVVEVVNDDLPPWDDEPPRSIEVVQTLPREIAARSLPPLGGGALAEALTSARRSVDSLDALVMADHQQLGHLAAVLVRSDAMASSQIEQVGTSSEALAVALADLDESGEAVVPAGANDAWLVAGAVEIVQSAVDETGGVVTASWLKHLQGALLRHDLEIRPDHLGEWRDCPVWIGPSRKKAVFEGPPFARVPALIDDLIGFTRREDIDAIVRAAIAHAQFETIHPFVDGNGRVGRALIHRILGSSRVPVPVAHGLLVDLGAYIDGLNAYRRGDLETWLLAFAVAVDRGAVAAVGLIESLQRLRAHFHRRVPTRGNSAMRRVLDDLIGQPVVTSLMIRRRYGVTAARASQITSQLVEQGILRRATVWAPTSHAVWVAPDVLAAIDALGEPRST